MSLSFHTNRLAGFNSSFNSGKYKLSYAISVIKDVKKAEWPKTKIGKGLKKPKISTSELNTSLKSALKASKGTNNIIAMAKFYEKKGETLSDELFMTGGTYDSKAVDPSSQLWLEYASGEHNKKALNDLLAFGCGVGSFFEDIKNLTCGGLGMISEYSLPNQLYKTVSGKDLPYVDALYDQSATHACTDFSNKHTEDLINNTDFLIADEVRRSAKNAQGAGRNTAAIASSFLGTGGAVAAAMSHGGEVQRKAINSGKNRNLAIASGWLTAGTDVGLNWASGQVSKGASKLGTKLGSSESVNKAVTKLTSEKSLASRAVNKLMSNSTVEKVVQKGTGASINTTGQFLLNTTASALRGKNPVSKKVLKENLANAGASATVDLIKAPIVNKIKQKRAAGKGPEPEEVDLPVLKNRLDNTKMKSYKENAEAGIIDNIKSAFGGVLNNILNPDAERVYSIKSKEEKEKKQTKKK